MGQLQTIVWSDQFFIDRLNGVFPEINVGLGNEMAKSVGVLIDSAVERGGGGGEESVDGRGDDADNGGVRLGGACWFWGD